MRTRLSAAIMAAALLIIVLALVACGGGVPDAESPVIAATPPATPLPQPSATIAPTDTAEPSPVPSPTPTHTPTPTPTPEPVTLAAPPEWESDVRLALEAMNESGASPYAWSLLVEEDIEAALAGGRAQIALSRDDSGAIVRREPLAFSVPFTTEWENLLPAEAENVLANGHYLIRVIRWSDMTPDNKAMRVDGRHPTDPDYPYMETWSLVSASGYEEATAELAGVLAEALAPLPTIRIAAVGDLNLDRSVGYIITTTGDPAYPLSLVKPVFDAADYAIGNLETALGDVGEPAAKLYPFRSPPEAAKALAIGGVDLVSLANNHAQDYGPEALLQGINLLQAAGVATVGGGANEAAAHAPHIAEIGGLKVAFLGYVNVPVEAETHFDTRSWSATADTPGLAWGDPARMSADVAAIRPEVDLVVVILHSGFEYIEEPGEEQVAAARAAIDAGADLVVGHHAHILQGIHHYGEGVIAYGMGNFLFDIDGPRETAILNVWLDRNGVRQLELVPAIIQEHGQPRLAQPEEAGPILSRVYYLTMLLNAANP